MDMHFLRTSILYVNQRFDASEDAALNACRAAVRFGNFRNKDYMRNRFIEDDSCDVDQVVDLLRLLDRAMFVIVDEAHIGDIGPLERLMTERLIPEQMGGMILLSSDYDWVTRR
jgi:hypothetical protein